MVVSETETHCGFVGGVGVRLKDCVRVSRLRFYHLPWPNTGKMVEGR